MSLHSRRGGFVNCRLWGMGSCASHWNMSRAQTTAFKGAQRLEIGDAAVRSAKLCAPSKLTRVAIPSVPLRRPPGRWAPCRPRSQFDSPRTIRSIHRSRPASWCSVARKEPHALRAPGCFARWVGGCPSSVKGLCDANLRELVGVMRMPSAKMGCEL